MTPDEFNFPPRREMPDRSAPVSGYLAAATLGCVGLGLVMAGWGLAIGSYFAFCFACGFGVVGATYGTVAGVVGTAFGSILSGLAGPRWRRTVAAVIGGGVGLAAGVVPLAMVWPGLVRELRGVETLVTVSSIAAVLGTAVLAAAGAIGGAFERDD